MHLAAILMNGFACALNTWVYTKQEKTLNLVCALLTGLLALYLIAGSL